MDYQLYENSEILLNENSGSSKNSWNLASDCTMDNQADLFGWGPLKIDEQEKISKKRRLPMENEEDKNKHVAKETMPMGGKIASLKKNVPQRGAVKMQHWQVEDYGDLNSDIESSLNLNANDLVGNSYTVSGNILGMNSLTVFKQEAPSPTSSDVTTLQVARKNRESPASSHHSNTGINSTMDDNNSQNMFNNTINQLLSQDNLAGLHNVMENNSLPSPNSQDNYIVSSTNYNLIEDNRFQYVLAAATSIATKQNEDTLTYLNQGQSYEIKLKKLGDLSFYRGKLLKSYIRICFHERRLQFMEREQMLSWQNARPGDRIIEADIPLSYGAFDVTQPANAVNSICFSWDPTKEVGVYIKVNCISTEFTQKKHGGEKGVPFRIQIETYQNSDSQARRLHAAACQIKVFKLKGADRKHKQDREKILKRPISEQEKYQPSYECTVLNDLPNDSPSTPPMSPVSVDSNTESNPQVKNGSVAKGESTGDVRKIVQEPAVSTQRESRQLLPTSTNNQFSQNSTPQEVAQWLMQNRFDKYLETFESFSGDDLLKMSRDDLTSICGRADGIRLYNAVQSKPLEPKLKIYVCRENTTLFNAVFLTSYNKMELTQKLLNMVGMSHNQVLDIYLEGPHSIQIQLTNDVVKYLREESMFVLHVIAQENNGYILLLKKATGA